MGCRTPEWISLPDSAFTDKIDKSDLEAAANQECRHPRHDQRDRLAAATHHPLKAALVSTAVASADVRGGGNGVVFREADGVAKVRRLFQFILFHSSSPTTYNWHHQQGSVERDLLYILLWRSERAIAENKQIWIDERVRSLLHVHGLYVYAQALYFVIHAIVCRHVR